jgi:hypothetical protein
MNLEDYHDSDRREDVIAQTSQIGLFQEANAAGPPENKTFEERENIIGEDQEIPSKFQEKLGTEEWKRLDVNEYPNVEEDHQQSKILNAKLIKIITQNELRRYIERRVTN